MAFLDSTIVNVALPAIGEDFGASTSQLQWIVNGYLLSLASLILLGGALGDRMGRRRVFVAGSWLFTGASLLCALAPSVDLLIAARLVQGIGGALLTPGSLAIIESSFRRQDRARAIGAWSGMTGVVSAIGPLLGGFLIEAVSWRAAFLINPPLGLIVALAARHVPESRDPTARGAALAALALGATTYALIDGPDRGWPPAIVLTAVGGVLAFVLFPAHRASQRQSDAAARHLRLAPVQRRQRRHVRRLRLARRPLLPLRVVPAGLAEVLGDRGGRRAAPRRPP
jgi:MFS family permease